jgi:steroid 5-alpha reductase family enzyme
VAAATDGTTQEMEGRVATWQVWLGGLGAVSAMMVLVWVVSLVRRDASLVDRVWGLAFVVAAWAYALLAGAFTSRTWLILALVTIWGLRLSIYITWRNWGDGEDPRYRDMREKRPETFALRSLVTVFLLQAVLAWLISLPLLAAAAYDTPAELGWLDLLGTVVWGVGLFFEAVGDWQLSRFLADPGNRGKVNDRGLWRYTRHPNYFGDTVVWWGYFLIALATGAWWAFLGSLGMTFFIVRVSGVALTEKNMAGRSKREGYEEYVRRTNAFIPGPRKD